MERDSANMNELDKDQISMLKSTFDAFDLERKGYIETEMIGTIMDMLGAQVDAEKLESIINEIDEDKNGEITFDEFLTLAAKFLVDDEDNEDMQTELKGAFRMYDKEGKNISQRNGFITTEVLREILREIDDNLSESDLDNMIEEIDTDGSGTVDWEEFQAIMTG